VGEDYVLLGTVPVRYADRLREALESQGCGFFPFGGIIKARGLFIINPDGSFREIPARGYDHFSEEGEKK